MLGAVLDLTSGVVLAHFIPRQFVQRHNSQLSSQPTNAPNINHQKQHENIMNSQVLVNTISIERLLECYVKPPIGGLCNTMSIGRLASGMLVLILALIHHLAMY